MLNKLLKKIHDVYISKIESEKKRINDERWAVEKIDGYIASYFNHGFPIIRNLFGELPFLREPPIIEACVKESVYRKLNR